MEFQPHLMHVLPPLPEPILLPPERPPEGLSLVRVLYPVLEPFVTQLMPALLQQRNR